MQVWLQLYTSAGPGAVFWMWVIAFIGAGTAFAESALAQAYKVKVDGEYKGGRCLLHRKGNGNPYLRSNAYALAAILANGITGPTIQAFNFADSAQTGIRTESMDKRRDHCCLLCSGRFRRK